ncbi:MAG: DUF4261 domain-containing protein [Gemmataceae bacterium]|nr:DUF4261 domain-containing protein [Gemmataceae bacterium]MCS7269678.1 DUF4261 domain-containing protein [Gemmataceae bacterium]MDW8243583.1 DUF4261 domain-containing protein [Thermogemmata sp.]
MELRERFFGRGERRQGGPPIANPLLVDPPAVGVLFASAPLSLPAESIQATLREYHRDLAEATVELTEVPAPADVQQIPAPPSAIIGLLAWGAHVVKLVGFNAPMPVSVLDSCIAPAHYAPELKQQAYQHAAHVLLYYAGYDADPLEQYVALAAATAALARCGALVALNEQAHTSVPAAVFLPHEEDNGDTLQALRALPLPFFFAGFVKLEVAGEEGVWMRTYGCHTFGLPDLAIRAEGHHRGSAVFTLFSNMLDYLRFEGQTFAAGDTIGTSDGEYLRLRVRQSTEWFLEGNEPLFVLEPLPPEERALWVPPTGQQGGTE